MVNRDRSSHSGNYVMVNRDRSSHSGNYVMVNRDHSGNYVMVNRDRSSHSGNYVRMMYLGCRVIDYLTFQFLYVQNNCFLLP